MPDGAKTGKVSKKTPQDWSRAGLKRLASHGLDAVRVELLANDLGVTKGSFYWHFRDRQALLDSMVQQWEVSATDDVILAVERSGPDPQARLRRLFETTTAGFDAPLELALRAWGRLDSNVGAIVEGVDARRIATLRRFLKEIGFGGAAIEARAFLLYSALFGAALLPPSHGRVSRRRVLEEVFEMLSGSSVQVPSSD